jgi:hypothetical protein
VVATFGTYEELVSQNKLDAISLQLDRVKVERFLRLGRPTYIAKKARKIIADKDKQQMGCVPSGE